METKARKGSGGAVGEELGTLAGGIAHSFNNLLTGIVASAELALMQLDEGTPARDDLELILESSERAATLTRQLLAYAGGAELHRQPTDLGAEIGSLVCGLAPALGRTGVAVELPHAPVTADVDRTGLRELLSVLLLNACDAVTEGGSIRVTLAVEAGEPASPGGAAAALPGDGSARARIEVHDDGAGIAPEILGRIFDPFFTTKFMGQGLGLAAAQGIARAHGGSLDVASVAGAGSTFTLRLPLAADGPGFPEGP